MDDKENLGVPSPIKIGRPRPAGMLIEVHEHGTPTIPRLIELLASLALLILYVVSASIAMSAENSWAHILGNISFTLLIAAGSMAIIEHVVKKDGEHEHKSSSLKDLPPEVRDIMEKLSRT